MDILIIGGTRFVGRALSNYIVEQGHNLTLFHRGQTKPDFMPDVDRILGDRETDLDKLKDRTWDVVIDTCGYVPRIVKLSVEALKDKVDHYVFISTISTYKPTEVIGKDEDAELGVLEDETTEEIDGDTYGPLKVLCENEVLEVFGKNATIIRPGLIVGPYDPTNRFTYWLTRIRKGKDILAPGDGSFPVQFIDVRDLAKFIVSLAEDQIPGIYNATGPAEPMRLETLLQTITEILQVSDLNIHWIENEWLVEKEIGAFMEMPLWIPSKEGEAMMQVSIQRALDKGLEFRPIKQTIEDTLAWYDEINGDSQEWSAGLDPEKEQNLLEEYLRS